MRGLAVAALVAVLGAGAAAQETKLPPRPKDLDRALLEKVVAPNVAGGLGLEVVDRATDEPVAGADVFVVEAGAIEGVQRGLRELQQSLAHEPGVFDTSVYHRLLAHWYGTRYRTGADGTVVVAPFEGGTVVVSAGDRFAVETFRRWPAQPPTIHLVAQQYVEVRVVDSDGRPAPEVPVGFGQLLDQGPREPFFLPVLEGRSDGAGRVRVPRNRLPAGTELTVQALVLTRSPVREKLVRDAGGGQPALPTLQLPPCGMVRVLLYDENERPVERLRSAELQEAKADEPRDFRTRVGRPSQRDRGSAHFRWVGIGMKVRAVVGIDGMDGTLTHEQDGPTRAGELVVCGVRMTAGNPILRLRALDPAGNPMVRATLGLVRATATSFDGREITTDAEARVQWTVDPEWLGSEEGLVLLIARGAGTEQTLYQGAFAVDLAGLRAGITDLGEVRFVEEPVVLGGVVVDPDGKPRPDVVVCATLSHRTDTRTASSSSSGRALFFEHRVATDAQGRFEIRELKPKDVRTSLVLADRDWVLAAPVDAAPGETGVTLRVVRPGTLALTLADATRATALRFSLHAQDDPESPRYGESRVDGAAWKGLVPGRYRLAVATTDLEIDVLTDLDVPAGGACSDARLQQLDLSAHVRVIEVAVRGPGAVPLESVPVHCMHVRGGLRGGNVHQATTNQDGKVRFVVSLKDNKLFVHHRDHRSAEVVEPTGDCRLDLVARASVQVLLPEGVKLPDGVGLLVEPVERQWWAESEVRSETTWKNGAPVVLRPDRDGELAIVLRDRDGGTLWRGKLTVPAGDSVAATLPLDAETAVDIGRRFAESGR